MQPAGGERWRRTDSLLARVLILSTRTLTLDLLFLDRKAGSHTSPPLLARCSCWLRWQDSSPLPACAGRVRHQRLTPAASAAVHPSVLALGFFCS